MKSYAYNVVMGVVTTLKGMMLTIRYLFTKPVTMEYPEEVWRVPTGYRGWHEYDVDKCIGCYICANACPVDCIYIDLERVNKKLKITRFEIDYSKCLFCNLCCEPCPTKCIWMANAYDCSSLDRNDMLVDFIKVGGRSSPNCKRAESPMADLPMYPPILTGAEVGVPPSANPGN